MKKLLMIIPVLLLTAAAIAQPTVNDPNAEIRAVKSFHAISVSNAFDVFLTQGSEEKVAVSAGDAKDLANITVEVKNGVLQIGWDNKGRWNRGNKKLKAYISFKTIDALSASGACDVSIVGALKADDLKINMSGASDLKGRVEAKKITVDLSGASDTRISGIASQLNVEASGASSFKCFDLATEYCNARASGASDIKITVNKELSASASGASDIDYKGAGVIKDIKTSGASSISRS
ncbi:MAG: DUF2807 domain-containing protein [Chitinophagaceae bacterium]|nr:DUF2807 domain-containing protein [Chitinophagaceae bacterium]